MESPLRDAEQPSYGAKHPEFTHGQTRLASVRCRVAYRCRYPAVVGEPLPGLPSRSAGKSLWLSGKALRACLRSFPPWRAERA